MVMLVALEVMTALLTGEVMVMVGLALTVKEAVAVEVALAAVVAVALIVCAPLDGLFHVYE